MTVRELIAWLESQDQDAIVRVVEHTVGTGYLDQGGNADLADFDTDLDLDLFEYTDFRDNRFVKSTAPNYNKRYLLLGRLNGEARRV